MSLVGTTISGRYAIERLLGEGGMGAVYAAEHTLMHKRVAIKILHADMSQNAEVVSRFEREAMAAAHIDHPNVAAATDFGKLDDGSFFLVLELVEGKSLREAIAAGGFSVRRAVHVTKQIASALSRAHALGVVHRDLKPENVMLIARDDDPDFVKVLDFGIAKVSPDSFHGTTPSKAGEALTRAGMIYGTPEYMPPEQALGEEVDARADVYALGVMLYEMLAGKRPFDDESRVKLLGMHINAPVPAMPAERQIPAELEALVRRMLAKVPADRIQDVREVQSALEAFATSAPIVMSQPSLPSIASASAPHPVASSRTLLALDQHAKNLTHDVTRIFPPKVILAAALAIGVLASFTVGALLWKGAAGATPSASSVAADAAAATPANARFDLELKLAQGEIAATRWDDALAHAKSLEALDATRPEPYHVAFQADVGKGDVKSALSDASAWLDLDATAQSDAQLRELVRAELVAHDESAFALVDSGKMGAAGADILYDLAYGSQQPAAIQTRARHALAKDAVVAHASAALRVAVDLRNAASCEAKKNLLDRAAQEGDARALAVVESLSAKGGCGFLGMRDCNACLHKDDALARATQTLRARVAP